ncbi:DUF502 domain-containing protein [Natranaerobius thermophilus]|uniref:DUF502 domain-containing protein n=1 Tax=Natranaerobius thermophilus (strain ATCC BAA-1301 / DSM 18059 / JW/NM-WN-LF) TaxID=457570 RepID=B2A1Y0_NATTJ|nr:DUF502 domain-containing protein [Natranaerobius thermophilus]ACB84785.1 protein of unknown function DUF502 [Natranaerobius thermophilus JW/NM-WN-LF]
MARTVLKKVRNYFIAGIIVLLPIVTSIYLFWVLFNWLDSLVGWPLKVVPSDLPGAGIVSAIIIIFLTGLLATNIVGKKILSLMDLIFSRVPFVRNIYIAVKQLLDTFSQNSKTSFKKVVMVEYPRKGIYAMGFATGDAKGEPQKRTSSNLLSIFIPTTPNPTSGMLIMVPKENVTFLDMSIEEGLKFVISGGVVAPPVADMHDKTYIKEGQGEYEEKRN